MILRSFLSHGINNEATVKKNRTILVSIPLLILISISGFAQNIAKRSSYKIPLVRLRVKPDKEAPEFKKVRVDIDADNEYVLITWLNDLHVKMTKKGKTKTTYVENVQFASALTDFEARNFKRVVKSFLSTLEIFEKDLHKERWDRCLYLDSYFPRFMKGFYHLSNAAFNSTSTLPDKAVFSEELYDISLNSLKSDGRIRQWKRSDHIIKLRIATRELIYHLGNWQKKEIANYKEDPFITYPDNLKEAYCLFVKMYFNIV